MPSDNVPSWDPYETGMVRDNSGDLAFIEAAEDRAYDEMTSLGAQLHRRPSSTVLKRAFSQARSRYLALSATRERMERDSDGR